MAAAGTGRHCLVPVPAAATRQARPEATAGTRAQGRRKGRRPRSCRCLWHVAGSVPFSRRAVCHPEARLGCGICAGWPVVRHKIRLQPNHGTAMGRHIFRHSPCAETWCDTKARKPAPVTGEVRAGRVPSRKPGPELGKLSHRTIQRRPKSAPTPQPVPDSNCPKEKAPVVPGPVRTKAGAVAAPAPRAGYLGSLPCTPST